jgi:hypothetical protein
MATIADEVQSDSTNAEMSSIISTPTEQPSSATSSTYHRTPSIRFLGKAGWAERIRVSKVITDVVAAPDQVFQQLASVQLEPDDITWNPAYGRPPITEKEIESLVMGGATEAPKLIKPSIGATFE